MTTAADLPTEEDYTAAIERIDRAYGSDAESFIFELIETVRDDETIHDTEDGKCVADCVGCLSERIADAVTRAVVGKAA